MIASVVTQAAEAIKKYSGLALRPNGGGEIELVGPFAFQTSLNGKTIQGTFDLRLLFPRNFPVDLPAVWDIGLRVPKTFHTNGDGSLCLGAPLRLKQVLQPNPTITGFIESCVVPFLAGFLVRQETGSLPFGELEHGRAGLLEDYKDLLGVPDREAAREFLRLASLHKRIANKKPCYCGSGLRAGICHNRRINGVRNTFGRRFLKLAIKKL